MTPTRRAPTRRGLIAAPALLAIAVSRPALGETQTMQQAIREFLGEAGPVRAGRVRLELPPLVESGNAVPLDVAVDSPMTEAEHVRSIAVFNERNPLPQVIVAHLSPRSGAARLSARIRLATSQRITALAVMNDGSVWSDTAEVIVTLAACVEG
jgi:sulfur-oxidizing protein SoxY